MSIPISLAEAVRAPSHTRRSHPDEPDDNSHDSAHPSEQLVDTLPNNYLFSLTLRKEHLRGSLGLQLYDTHAVSFSDRAS